MRKKVLVVCMINSVHSAKWLAQFEHSEIDFYIFPSAYFRKIHPLIKNLIESDSSATYSIQAPVITAGWVDYFQERILKTISPHFSRKNRLNRFMKSVKPDTVHALEFQHAAYLCSEVIDSFGKNFEFIATNWGSDIYHFMNISEHKTRISTVLAQADKYSAECVRDYNLATELGFKGYLLPVIPNSGGFLIQEITKPRSSASSRRLILVKGYGGYFGRAEFVMTALEPILDKSTDYSVFFYSITDDLLSQVLQLQAKFQNRVNFSTVANPLKYEEIQELFSQARIYIGCSISDGISTSFLEALVAGSYPIQTNTSCANEWLSKGAKASLLDLNIDELTEAIDLAICDDSLVDEAQAINSKIAQQHLDSIEISKMARTFY